MNLPEVFLPGWTYLWLIPRFLIHVACHIYSGVPAWNIWVTDPLSYWPTEWLQHLYLGKPASAVACFYIYLGLRSRCYKTVDVNWRTSRELWRVSKPFFSILSLTLSGSPPLPRSHLTSVSPPLSFISFLLSHSLALPFSSWLHLQLLCWIFSYLRTFFQQPSIHSAVYPLISILTY